MGDRGQRWRRDVHENSRRVRVAMMVRWLGSALDMVGMLQGGRGGCLSVLLVSRACVPEIDARAGVACSDQCMLLAHEICLVTERNAWAPACSRQAKVEASNSPIRPCSPGGDRPGTRASGDGGTAGPRPVLAAGPPAAFSQRCKKFCLCKQRSNARRTRAEPQCGPNQYRTQLVHRAYRGPTRSQQHPPRRGRHATRTRHSPNG